MAKIAIVGSRYFDNYHLFKLILLPYRKQFEFDMIISGGAAGVDTLAYKYAIENGITFVCQPPKPEDGYPRAYYRRNLRIVEQSEIIIALPQGRSPGTRHTISLANKLKKQIEIIELQGA